MGHSRRLTKHAMFIRKQHVGSFPVFMRVRVGQRCFLFCVFVFALFLLLFTYLPNNIICTMHSAFLSFRCNCGTTYYHYIYFLIYCIITTYTVVIFITGLQDNKLLPCHFSFPVGTPWYRTEPNFPNAGDDRCDRLYKTKQLHAQPQEGT